MSLVLALAFAFLFAGLLPANLPAALTMTWVGALGLVVGSFLNVVIHRVPRGESVVSPRSRCPGCHEPIAWFQNIPVFSWLLLRGRCARCRIPISWRYPGVELLTCAVFIAAHERLGFTPGLALALPFAAAILALVFIDAEHMLLPDAITLPMAFAGLALSFVSPLTSPADALLGVLLSWFVLEGMNLAYKLVRGRDGFGGGDTKMMLMVGAFLGWQMALFTMVAGSFLGVLVGIPALLLLGRRAGAKADGAPGESPANPEPPEGDALLADGQDSPPEAEPSPTLRELMPQSIDETLPLLIVPACASAWMFEGGSPERALAGLLLGVAAAFVLHRALRRRGQQSPLSRILPLAGALAGLPLRLLPLGIAGGLLALLVVLFRPRALAPAESPGSQEVPAAESETGAGADSTADARVHLQSELPFGVFLGAAALLALLWGEPLLEWYLETSGRFFGGSWDETWPDGPGSP